MSTVRIEDGVPWIGDRAYPWAKMVISQNDDIDDDIDDGIVGSPWRVRVVQLAFENGWTLSIIWGDGTYSTNHHRLFDDEPEFQEAATEVEVGAWPDSRGLIEWPDGDTVQGYVTVPQLEHLIDVMQQWPSHPPDDFVAPIEWESER